MSSRAPMLFALLAATFVLATAIGCSAANEAPDSPATSTAAPADDSVITNRDLETNTSISSIDIDEIVGRGLRRNSIPSLSQPEFVSLENAVAPAQDVRGILFEHDGDMRFYPGNILAWHEVVNDTVGGRPVVVTY